MKAIASCTPAGMFRGVTMLAVCLFAVGELAGCASGQRLGRGATSGAVEELQMQAQRREARGERGPMEQAAGNAVKGTLDELEDPRRQEQLGRVVGLAAESAVRGAVGAFEDRAGWWGGTGGPNGPPIGLLGARLSTGMAQGFSRQLRSELGANGEGPLGKSLSGWLHQASGAVVTGFIADLSPVDSEWRAGSREAIDQRVYELSRTAATGFTDGVTQRLGVPVIVLSFGAGLVVAFAVAGMLQKYRRGAQDRV